MGILKIKSCFTELKSEVEETLGKYMLRSRLKVIESCQQESQFLGHEGGRQGSAGV